MKTTRVFLQNHQPIQFTFLQNSDDFFVEEIPLEPFTKKGNFLVLKIKKVYISTWELIYHISKILDIDEHQIGYAGLKDKNATTIQYISIPLKKAKEYRKLNNKDIKVLDTFLHNQKLKIGNLKGNRFKIKLHDIKSDDLSTIYQTISQIQKNGMPNYFGYQRFGKDTSFKQCKNVVYGEVIQKDKKLKHLLISAYQSYFFNAWLIKRIEISKEEGVNKLLDLDGDIFLDKNKKIITGLMPGRKVLRANKEAREIEEQFDDIYIHEKGLRRVAWIKPENIKNKFKKENNSLELEFTLPKSSYATVFIENILNKNLSPKLKMWS